MTDDDHHGDEQRVEAIASEGHVGQRLGIVGPGDGIRYPAGWELEDLVVWLKRRRDHPEEGQQEEEGDKDRQSIANCCSQPLAHL